MWFARQTSLSPKIPYTAVLPCILLMARLALCVPKQSLAVLLAILLGSVRFVLRGLIISMVCVVIQT